MVAEWLRRWLGTERHAPRRDDHEVWLEGRQASASLNDPALDRAFDALADQYASEWANTDRRDVDARESAYQRLSALKDVRGHLVVAVREGQEKAPE